MGSKQKRLQQYHKELEIIITIYNKRIEALITDIARTLEDESERLLNLQHRLAIIEERRERLIDELDQLDLTQDTTTKEIQLPIVVISMTNQQATELLEGQAFTQNHTHIAPIEKNQFEKLKRDIPPNKLTELLQHYSDQKENWKPYLDDENTIRETVHQLAQEMRQTPAKYNHFTIYPYFVSKQFFNPNKTQQLAEWHTLSQMGCLLIVDALSMFHPHIYHHVLHSEMGADRRVAVATALFSPLLHQHSTATHLIKQALKQRMQRALFRGDKGNDILCGHWIENPPSFKRWFTQATPHIAKIVHTYHTKKQADPNNRTKFREHESIKPKPIGKLIFEQGSFS